MTNFDTSGRITTQDFLIYTDNQEVRCGKIKVNNASNKLKEEDRARLGERMKRQLHHRIKHAKTTREFQTFGIFISDNSIELYSCTFSIDRGYELIKLKQLTLPTLESTYPSTAESLELLFTFKVTLSNLDTKQTFNAIYIGMHYQLHARSCWK